MPVIVPAQICGGPWELDTLKRNREAILLPLLAKHPNVPVVTFGVSASYIAGGKCTDTSMVNKALILYDRVCSFTYSYDYYLDSGRTPQVLQNIETTIKAAVREEQHFKWKEGLPDLSNSQLIIDVESTSPEYPWYGSKLTEIGIKGIKDEPSQTEYYAQPPS